MVKIAIIIVLIVTVILGGTGCMFNHQQNATSPSLSANDLALLHMQEKYGETFTYAAPWGNSMTGTREFLATCSSLPNQLVLVQILDYESNAPVYKDNYLAAKYQAEISTYFHDIAAEVFGDAIIHHEVSKQSVSQHLSKDTSFQTFYEDVSTVVTAYIEIKGSSYTTIRQFDQLFSKLNGSNGQIMVSVIVVDDSIYGTLDSTELNILLYQEKDVANAFAETANGSFQYDFSEGG